ncbi:hypothetical protein FEM48_Zijuj03G0092900 [Ziziphus jujuba var. spinosa]|uniref:CASP-like protein n=1 Tax=Ziziphus jujuba var. spinosa TaxID=714518 RepID=A0A978VPG4_ZIZJJ|nr:hypothetical protein FEM48_Zijuj03G0092900 [Ziziphus jujuba var. spinosa]
MNASRPSVHPVEAPPPATDAAAGENPLPRGRMKDIQGMPGTRGGLALRLSQFAFAVVALCIMASTSDFPSVTAFRCLVAAASLQSLWSLSLAIIDIYAILVRRSLRNFRVVSIFAMGDGVINFLLKTLTKLTYYFTVKRHFIVDIGANCIPELNIGPEVHLRSMKRKKDEGEQYYLYDLLRACHLITSTLIFSAACASAGITVLIGNDLNDCAQNHCARFETATAMAFMSWFAVSPSFLLNFWTLASK